MDSVIDMPDLHCLSFGGMKMKHGVILEPFDTPEEIIVSLTCLPSTTNLPLGSCHFFLLLLNSELFACLSFFYETESILTQNLT